MDYVPNGCLYDVIDNYEGVGEPAARFLMKQLINATEYMQNQNIVHGDLKIENILINSNMDIKITDFGFATYQNKEEQLNRCAGTVTYVAPEILKQKQYDGFKADIFSLGVILYITVNGSFPFNEAKDSDEYYNLLKS